jgi:hypothetical protein
MFEMDENEKNYEVKIKSNPFSFWEVQPQYDFTEDLSKVNEFYRFKNLGTNMYLCALNQQSLKGNQIFLTDDYSNPNTLF